MSDRLNDLRRERAVIQAHLAWLDREIAAQSGPDAPAPAQTPATPAIPSAPVTASTPVPPPASAAATDTPSPEIDAALASYRQDPVALQSDIRKGCFLYFGFACLLLLLAVGGFYLYSRNLHAERAAPALEHPGTR